MQTTDHGDVFSGLEEIGKTPEEFNSAIFSWRIGEPIKVNDDEK